MPEEAKNIPENPSWWVPVYWPEGVTVGRAKISDDGTHIDIKLIEGTTIWDNTSKGYISDISINARKGENDGTGKIS